MLNGVHRYQEVADVKIIARNVLKGTIKSVEHGAVNSESGDSVTGTAGDSLHYYKEFC